MNPVEHYSQTDWKFGQRSQFVTEHVTPHDYPELIGLNPVVHSKQTEVESGSLRGLFKDIYYILQFGMFYRMQELFIEKSL